MTKTSGIAARQSAVAGGAQGESEDGGGEAQVIKEWREGISALKEQFVQNSDLRLAEITIEALGTISAEANYSILSEANCEVQSVEENLI